MSSIPIEARSPSTVRIIYSDEFQAAFAPWKLSLKDQDVEDVPNLMEQVFIIFWRPAFIDLCFQVLKVLFKPLFDS
jgi:hypothetical protein